jgi:hypothetical protein
MQIQNQNNILRNKTLVDPSGPARNHLTFDIVLKGDVLLAFHGVEQPEPMSHVFSRPSSCINRRIWDEQMAQHWG